DPELQVVEDVDFYIRAIRRFGCIFLDRVVLHYRTGPASLMHDLDGNQAVVSSYQRIFANYREAHGGGEMLALKLVARTALRWLWFCCRARRHAARRIHHSGTPDSD